jgi:MoxR-like ATPase
VARKTAGAGRKTRNPDIASHVAAGIALDFTEPFERALRLMEETRRHVFVTGRAGTGKSTLLQHFKETTA